MKTNNEWIIELAEKSQNINNKLDEVNNKNKHTVLTNIISEILLDNTKNNDDISSAYKWFNENYDPNNSYIKDFINSTKIGHKNNLYKMYKYRQQTIPTQQQSSVDKTETIDKDGNKLIIGNHVKTNESKVGKIISITGKKDNKDNDFIIIELKNKEIEGVRNKSCTLTTDDLTDDDFVDSHFDVDKLDDLVIGENFKFTNPFLDCPEGIYIGKIKDIKKDTDGKINSFTVEFKNTFEEIDIEDMDGSKTTDEITNLCKDSDSLSDDENIEHQFNKGDQVIVTITPKKGDPYKRTGNISDIKNNKYSVIYTNPDGSKTKPFTGILEEDIISAIPPKPSHEDGMLEPYSDALPTAKLSNIYDFIKNPVPHFKNKIDGYIGSLVTYNFWLETNFNKPKNLIEIDMDYYIGGNNYIYIKDTNGKYVLLCFQYVNKDENDNPFFEYYFIHKDSDTIIRYTPYRN